LQLGPDLTFDDAARLVPYLAALGISDCYISPFFEAASNRSHGYDVSDHSRFRAELGGEAAFDRFAQALRQHGLGLPSTSCRTTWGSPAAGTPGGPTCSCTARPRRTLRSSTSTGRR